MTPTVLIMPIDAALLAGLCLVAGSFIGYLIGRKA